MQSQKKENKKPTQLPPLGNKPQVLNPQVLSPHDIEKEILVKQVESLKYNLKQLTRQNEKLQDNLHWADKFVKSLQRSVNLKEEGNAAILSAYNKILDCFAASTENFNRLAKLNDSLIKGEEWRPDIKEMMDYIKIPICVN